MGVETRRYRPAPAHRVVTLGTALSGPALTAGVFDVVKLHVEALEEGYGKLQHGRRNGPQVVVTDRTHERVLAGELVKMTADAGLVSRKVHLERPTLTLMALRALELFMLLNGV